MKVPADATPTHTRCGECGQHLKMFPAPDGVNWNVMCEPNCSKVVNTTQTWILVEFCEPFISPGSTAPIVRVKK